MEKIAIYRPSVYDLLEPLDSPMDINDFVNDHEEEAAMSDLVSLLTTEVASKSHILGCAQLIIPDGLIDDITAKVLRLADSEPCGLRGAVIYVDYMEGTVRTPLTSVVLDASIPNIFEFHLTLEADTTTWYHKMTSIIKALRRSGTILLSKDFQLEKNRLYPE